MKKTRIIAVCAILLATLSVCAFASSFEKSKVYENSFNDVEEGKWYADSIKDVYELGLMEGVSKDKFDIDSEMNVAQGITIACRLHSIYNELEIPEKKDGANWYSPYVQYCLENKIITENQFDSYNRPILSFEMVSLFAKALGNDYFPAVNEISGILDVHDNMDFFDDVMMFYNAGVLNGNDEHGSFLPMSVTTRKRAAVILTRTVLFDKRLKYSLEPMKESYTCDEVFKIVSAQTTPDTLDGISLIKADGYTVSAAEYRYYIFASQNDKSLLESLIRSSAAKSALIKEQKTEVSRENLGEILDLYYASRRESYGGISYFDALDAQSLTDSFFAKLITMNELYYLAISDYTENISEDEVFDYVNENDFVCIKHIFISKETEDAYKTALQIHLELEEGADFDELLAQYGQDSVLSSRDGGYYFTHGWKIKELEDAAFSLKAGEISGIVQSLSGYHIVKRFDIEKDELAKSPDYSTIAINAAAVQLSSTLSDMQKNITLSYADNFDVLSKILN